ncbi:MAG: L-threonylcarbamoyladenylate synthase [Pseudanabaenaceae cyanobacterium bins.68]|nr:L-threonylcarbamoyladenylate synthase [Pseudanabaenaceae cyanobacterium bins.68]
MQLHPQSPQTRQVDKIITALQKGAVMLYPTDTVYAIGCDLNHRQAVQRVRQIKANPHKPLTFLCSSLSDIAKYAVVDDSAYRLMRSLVPGPYTFILPATKLVPKLVVDPKRRTTGIRVPDAAIAQALLSNLGNPIISTSAHSQELTQVELFDQLQHQVDLIIDHGLEPTYRVSTIIDLTGDQPQLVRQGLGEFRC